MTYPGGKNGAGVYQTIINQMPPHDVYIEPFVGSGAVLRMKKAAASTIAIDRDEGLVRSLTAEIGDAISGLTVVCGDGIRFLQHRRDWGGRQLVYCDPPYLMSARRHPRRIYRYELEERDHIELLATLKCLPASIVISGYDSPLYRSMLEGWRRSTFQTMTRGGTLATEVLWMNYPEPAELHDYRYTGMGFRERERIKRKVDRWTSRLQTMPPIERQAVSAALLAKIGDSGSATGCGAK